LHTAIDGLQQVRPPVLPSSTAKTRSRAKPKTRPAPAGA
jgi:hypothetical protein